MYDDNFFIQPLDFFSVEFLNVDECESVGNDKNVFVFKNENKPTTYIQSESILYPMFRIEHKGRIIEVLSMAESYLVSGDGKTLEKITPKM